MVIVPPGGFAGFSQMTPASKVALGGGAARTTRATRTRKKGKTRRAKRASGRTRKTRMKFGSPAWQKKYKVGKFRKK